MCKRLRVELPSAAAATLLISAIKMTSSGVRRGGNQDTFILPGKTRAWRQRREGKTPVFVGG